MFIKNKIDFLSFPLLKHSAPVHVTRVGYMGREEITPSASFSQGMLPMVLASCIILRCNGGRSISATAVAFGDADVQ